MHIHTMLDTEQLTNIVLFKDEHDSIVGLITYDTDYSDRAYLIHTHSSKELLHEMIDFLVESEQSKIVVKANSNDSDLCAVLQERGFEPTRRVSGVLALDLNRSLEYEIPDSYSISRPNLRIDHWQYQLVIHKGFNHDGIPERWGDEVFIPTPNGNDALKVFALQEDTYCAHCGLWYTEGRTAYVEPVVTIPRHRKQGLAKAVVYEACKRAKSFGAKRAVVLSDQEFYSRIGFELSSEVYCWEKQLRPD